MLTLRNYQQESVDKIYQSAASGNKSIMVQSPPRTGKTVIMAEIARRATAKGNRILFMVHRKEIVDQVKSTFVRQDVNMSLAQIGMVQTFTRRVERLKKPSIIFVDEAHHVLAKSYMKIINAFPNALKLLFTATPYRLSGQGFEEVVDDMIVGKPISWLIQNNFLAPVDYYAPSQIDSIQLKVKRNGEFDDKSIEEAMKPKIYGNAVKHYQKLANNKQAIAYTYNIASAERLAAEFNANGISAKAVSSHTDKKERDQIIAQYKNGDIQIVTNNSLFTEGLDLPNVDCVIMLRPTQSLSLYLQFAMRSMNPRKNKRAIIIDHVGNVERFGLPTMDREWSLKGGDSKSNNEKRSEIKSVTVCSTCFATFYRKSDQCPFCGAELIEEKKIEVVDDAELKKVTERRLEMVHKVIDDELSFNVANKDRSELRNMEEVKAYGKLHNYKPQWAYFFGKQKGFIK